MGKTIGLGSFGKVRLGTHVDTGQHVAIKIISKDMLRAQKMCPQAKREIAIMKKLKHPNVACVNEVLVSQQKIHLHR